MANNYRKDIDETMQIPTFSWKNGLVISYHLERAQYSGYLINIFFKRIFY